MCKILERDKRLIMDYMSGLTVKKLTDKYGLKSSQITQILRYNDIAIKGGERVKKAISQAELSRLAPKIRELHSQGESFTSLAVRYNLEINQVLQVINSANCQ